MAAFGAVGAFIVTLVLFAVCWLPARLLLSSARARVHRARESASAITEDVTLFVRRGEVERAIQVLDSHGTVFAWALSRVLATDPADRPTCLSDLDEAWKSRLAGVPLAYYEPCSGLPLLPALLGAFLLAAIARKDGSGTVLELVGIVVAIILACVLGTWLISGCALKIHGERQALAEHYCACLAELARELDSPQNQCGAPPRR